MVDETVTRRMQDRIAEIQAELDETIADCQRYNTAWTHFFNEAQRLRKIIEEAPCGCRALVYDMPIESSDPLDHSARCWKRAALVDEKGGES